AAHLCVGQNRIDSQKVPTIARFRGEEEEGLVMPVIQLRNNDRPADRKRELVITQIVCWVLRSRAPSFGVRYWIAHVPEGSPAERIGPRLRGYVNHSSAGGTEF